MRKLEKFDGTKTYMFPNGSVATPTIMRQKYPALDYFTHIIETDEGGEVCFAVQNLSAMRTLNKIDASLSEADAIAAIQTIINTEPVQEVSAEERIAAALEYQNIASMTDTTTN